MSDPLLVLGATELYIYIYIYIYIYTYISILSFSITFLIKYLFWCLHLLTNSDLLFKTPLSQIELIIKTFLLSTIYNSSKLAIMVGMKYVFLKGRSEIIYKGRIFFALTWNFLQKRQKIFIMLCSIFKFSNLSKLNKSKLSVLAYLFMQNTCTLK